MTDRRPLDPEDTADARARSSREHALRRIGAVTWPSFFAAGVATMVFFAIVDPLELAAITWPTMDISRPVGYTIGFFLFWSCTLSASAFTALLLKRPGDRA